MSAFFSLHRGKRAEISDLRGYFMRHKTGSDVGFSWHKDDPQFSDEWERIEAAAANVEQVLALHRQLAAEKLRADQGWERYEAANADRNALGRMRQAFHINMMRAYPEKSHAEIGAEIDKACGIAAVEREDDFARIVRASSGQQVLFYKEVEEDGNTLHCIADFGDYQADMKIGGLPEDTFATVLDKADIAMADQVIEQVGGFMGGSPATGAKP